MLKNTEPNTNVDKSVYKTPQKPAEEPRVYKEEEYGLMCELIQDGLWGTSNLAKVVGVDRETIDNWKARAEAQEAYFTAVKNVLKKRKNRGEVEKEMKELDLEVANDSIDINTYYRQYTDEQLTDLANQKARSLGLLEPAQRD